MAEGLMSEFLSVVAMYDPFDGAGTTVVSDAWDMQKHRQVMAIIATGTIQAAGTLDARFEESATSNGTFTTLNGKAMTQFTTADAAKQVIMNLSSKELAATTITGARWARLHITAAAATVAFAAVVLGHRHRFHVPFTTVAYGDLASVDEIVV